MMNHTFEVLDKFCGENGIAEYFQEMITNRKPDDAVQEMLSFLGERCHSERTYIFELNGNETFSNTYEWCAKGIEPQKDLLQNESVEVISEWWALFENNAPVIIPNLEDIRETHPQIYAGLKPQNIKTLVTAPIRLNSVLIGFLGVDNPSEQKLEFLSKVLFVIANFISFVIEKRNLMNKVDHLSYHDQLTGAFNRRAYDEFTKRQAACKTIGLVYCDVSDLKITNSNYGYEIGDKLILKGYDILHSVFPNEQIFRTGNDEFVTICFDLSKECFEKLLVELKEIVRQNEYQMAIGATWSDKKPINIRDELSRAEKGMYWEKIRYYNQSNVPSNRERRRSNRIKKNIESDEKTEFATFLSRNYFDPEAFFKSVCTPDYYPFIADLTTNIFYISDEMKEEFGFENNMVADLIGEWEKRIGSQEELEFFRKDIHQVINGEQDIHDLRYRIRDKDGNYVWVHCHGIVKRSKDGLRPLFFSGGVSRQEQKFVIDPVTNFPREYGAMLRIQEMQSNKESVTIIGFTLNNFSEINELRGRNVADLLLRDISKKLVQYFEEKLSFFRLDGMRFIGIASKDGEENIELLIRELKEIIAGLYYNNNIVVRTPCSVGVICETEIKSTPQDLLVNMVTLLSSAKHSSDSEFVVHSPTNIHLQRQRTQMMMKLNKDVVDGFDGFRIVIQPSVSTEDFKLTSGEVLLRWQFEGKDVSPAVFIPILESNRLILPVGKWVFEQAVRTCKRIATFLPGFRLAVNVSYYQILEPDFLPFMEQTLKKYHLDGNRLILEITETHYDETPTKVFQFVESCKTLGMEVAIDDFGNGYSSLAFLLKYPASIVKLDRSLINEMVNSKDNINFISSIVYACHKFGKKVCAEGVETQTELDIVRVAGCDMIQGYYFYRPMELQDFYNLLPKIEYNVEKIDSYDPYYFDI